MRFVRLIDRFRAVSVSRLRSAAQPGAPSSTLHSQVVPPEASSKVERLVMPRAGLTVAARLRTW